MNRRSFLATSWRKPDRQGHDPIRPLSGLEPYTPTTSEPWDMIRAGHLLRRATFLPRWSDISALVALTPSDAVDLLLSTTYTPSPPTIADSVTESLEGLNLQLQEEVKGVWRSNARTLREWQADAMKNAPLTIIEKMIAFWSGHFTTEFETEDDFVQAPLLYRQNILFRDNALGNFRDMAKEITLNGGMLVYLGGSVNSAGTPNENYARELMELYTTGLGQYTEADIKEAARILTGWRVARFTDFPIPNGMFETYFDAAAHDIGAKEFMTISFPARDSTTNTEFIVRRDEIHRLIDVIFEQRSRAVARFICGKIYRFFVYSNPTASDQAVIEGMADIMVQNNFEIRPVMSALLKSAHFFDNANIGAQVKTPFELVIGLARQLGLGGDLPGDTDNLGQTIFDPPNVSGWPGWHDWVTTTTYPIRSAIARSAIAGAPDSSLMTMVQGIDGYDRLDTVVDRLAAVLLPRPLSTERRTVFKRKLVPSGLDYEWGDILASPSTAARNLRDMLTTLVDLPDFQLC